MEQQQQQQPEQQQYENMGSVRGGNGDGREIQQRIKNSLPLIIRILAYVQVVLSILIFAMEIGIIVYYNLFASAITSSENVAVLVGPLTAAGIWTSIVMGIATIFLFILCKKYVCVCVCVLFFLIIIN
jgi:hypothetical protein